MLRSPMGIARHRLEAMPHFTPWLRPADPHRLADIVARLSECIEPPQLRRVLDNEWRNDPKVFHKTILEEVEAARSL